MSPDGLLSLLIFCIETVLLINLFIFSENNETNKWVKLMLFILSLFQLSEFIICYNMINIPVMIYLQIMIAGLLPPVGLVLVQKYWGSEAKYKILYFIFPLIFLIYYPTVLDEFKLGECTFFLAAFEIPRGVFFGLYYYGFVLAAIATNIYYLLKCTDNSKKNLGLILLLGYILTFLPGSIIMLFNKIMLNSVESLFCKFAVFLAFALTYLGLKNKTRINH